MVAVDAEGVVERFADLIPGLFPKAEGSATGARMLQSANFGRDNLNERGKRKERRTTTLLYWSFRQVRN